MSVYIGDAGVMNKSADMTITNESNIPNINVPYTSDIRDEPGLKLIQEEVKSSSDQIKQLEELLLSRDTSVTNSLEELFNTLKTVSYNQTVLENKIEDALKNQMNTDNMVNRLTKKLEKLSETINISKYPIPKPICSIVTNKYSSSAGNLTSDASRRGPGRPRKDGSPAMFDKPNSELSSKLLLPVGSIQISKSKRYFIDPKVKNEPLNPVVKLNKSLSSSNISTNNEKRKRGRPPKKRTVDTVIINMDYDNDTEDVQTDSNMTDDIEDVVGINRESNANSVNATPVPTALSKTHLSESLLSSPPQRGSSKMATDTENPQGFQGAEVVIDLNLRHERELDKRRDDREKMLVNLKYNDRDKAKSFMESNKKLLQAMKEEEKRKKMTIITYDNPPTTNTIASPVPSLPFTNDQVLPNEVVKQSEINHKPNPIQKIGISSMLNFDDDQQLTQFQFVNGNASTKLSNQFSKRFRSDDEELDDADSSDSKLSSQFQRQLRKRRLTSEIGEDITTALNSNNSISLSSTSPGENKSSILTDHPIELICKDGLFYRRNSIINPITIGDYLKFKFQDKQDELSKANSGDGDYGEFTKQDRMNAYFFKPDIELETEQAYNILCNTTLTEKYVNSLEYFLMEFRWENKLVGLGMKLRESKRTWQRRKALFALFEFWRDQSREKRNFPYFTIIHAVKEMESYRIFINRSVSWFYNHITLLKMILYDLCDNMETQWREWMFPKEEPIPRLEVNDIKESNLNQAIDNILTLHFLENEQNNNDSDNLNGKHL